MDGRKPALNELVHFVVDKASLWTNGQGSCFFYITWTGSRSCRMRHKGKCSLDETWHLVLDKGLEQGSEQDFGEMRVLRLLKTQNQLLLEKITAQHWTLPVALFYTKAVK